MPRTDCAAVLRVFGWGDPLGKNGANSRPRGFNFIDSGTVVCFGDFVSLFVEGPGGDGYISVDSFADERVIVHRNGKPPNFERSCVFELMSPDHNVRIGEPVRSGAPSRIRAALTPSIIPRAVPRLESLKSNAIASGGKPLSRPVFSQCRRLWSRGGLPFCDQKQSSSLRL